MPSKKKSGQSPAKPARSKKPAQEASVPADVGPSAPAAEAPVPEATPKPTRRGRTSAKMVKAPKKEPKPVKPKRVSGLDAAAMVLAEAKAPMSVTEIFQAIEAKGLWRTEGKTPTATLYAAIIREISAKKHEARFRKTERGRFAANA